MIILLRNTQLEQFCSGDKRKCIEVEGKPISCWLAGDENDRLKVGRVSDIRNIAKGTTDPRVEFCLPK